MPRLRLLRNSWLALLTSAALVLVSSARAQNSTASLPIPDALRPSADQQKLFIAHAAGDQIYECESSGEQFKWLLKGPNARLFDPNNRFIGRHFAGPTWESTDHSAVTGKLVASANAPEAVSIPWLLLTATGHSGSGVMSSVTAIQRLNTKGGKAPLGGCDAATAGRETRVPYTAVYYFYGNRGQPRSTRSASPSAGSAAGSGALPKRISRIPGNQCFPPEFRSRSQLSIANRAISMVSACIQLTKPRGTAAFLLYRSC